MNRPDGVLRDMDEIDISMDAGWEGDPLAFVDALVSCRFLEKREDGVYFMHDWEEHQLYAVHAEERKEKARNAAAKRWGRVKNATSMPGAMLNNATSMPEAMPNNATSMPEAMPLPSPTPIPTPTPTPKEKENIVGQGCPTSPAIDESPETEKPIKPDPVPYSEIVGALNEVCGCQFKVNTKDTRRHIKARWNEGWRMPDFRAVIESRHAEWSGNPEMCRFLRPETLFGSKFESYLQFSRNGPVNGSEAGSTAPKNQDEIVRKIREARAERERKEQKLMEVAGYAA